MPENIVAATTDEDYRAFGALVREYLAWLQARYADTAWFIDAVASHQALDAELEALPATYGPPKGKVLLAVLDGQVSGGVAYRDLHDGTCEMKRLFVPDRFRGRGTGRLLCEALVASAKADGFEMMRLDTGYQNTEAMVMYESMGFRSCAPYHDYPAELVPHLRFMQLSLVAGPTTPIEA
ncbi:MAG: GNAT family N-acetyltransferase [Actinomycetes bacterium]